MPVVIGNQQNRTTRALLLHEVDPSKPDTIRQFVEARWTSRSSHRQRLERQWYLNVAQYLGYQYHTYDPSTGLMRLEPSRGRVRLTVNRLIGVVRKFVAKALRQRPHWVAIPATEDVDDQARAIVSHKLLAYYWRWLNMNRVLRQLFYWTGCTGNAFLSVVWDPEKGPELAMNEEDLADLERTFREKIPKRMREKILAGVFLGDPRVEVHSPFEIDPDPEALCIDDCAYLIHTKSRSPDWITGQFGEEFEDLSHDQDTSGTLTQFYERRIMNLQGAPGQVPYSGGDEGERGVRVHTLWVDPNHRHRRGWCAAVAGGRVLKVLDELPNPFRRIPFGHTVEIPVPGRFWGTSSLEQAIPIQANYNLARSRIIQSRNRMANPKWFLPKGSGVNEGQLDDSAGEVVEYNPPFRPETETPPAIPDFVRYELELTLKDLEDVTQIHEVTQARAPSGVRSGVAIAQLQEQDEQVLAPTFQGAEDEIGKIGGWLLQLLAANVSEERVVKITGDSRQVETLIFTGSDLIGQQDGKPGINYFDVETQIGSQLPLSREARRQAILQFIQLGVLDRVRDNRQIRDTLGLGTEEPALNFDLLDKQNARRENLLLARGAQLPVNSFDSDDIHLGEHELWQKTPEYQKIRNPQIDALFEDHKQGHRQRLIALQQAQQPQPPPGAAEAEGEPPVVIEPPPSVAESPQSLEEALALAQQSGLELPPEMLDALEEV